MDIYNKPQNTKAGRKSPPLYRKFKIPEKGRIRLVLILVLLVMGARLCGPMRGKRGAEPPVPATTDNSIVTDKKVAGVKDTLRDAIPRDNNNVSRKDKHRRAPVPTTNSKNILDDDIPPRKFQSRNKKRSAPKTPPRQPLPNHLMNFDDVRQLFKEHNIDIGSSTQTVVLDGSDGQRSRWGRDNKSIDNDTLTLSLSIDTALQQYANRLFRRYKPRYGAAAVIDPATGRVLALASFAGEGEDIDGGNLYVRSIFPAASVFKTVVAAAGVEHAKMNARTAIPHYGRHHTLFRTQLVENLRVSKDITLIDAFAYSVNPAFGRIALFHTNKDAVIDFGRRFGFHDTIPFEVDSEVSVMLSPDSDFSIAEFASGFNRETKISPLFGALLAGAVSADGIIYRPTVVDSIHSSLRDTSVYIRETEIWRRALKEPTATEMRRLMSAVTRYGTARTNYRPLRESQRLRHFEYGGKTGNVNQLGLGRVDWFVGYARNPNDKNQQVAVGVVTTHGEYWTVQSSFIAAELTRRYLNRFVTNRGQ